MFIHYFNRLSWQIFFSITLLIILLIIYKSEVSYNGLLREHYFKPFSIFVIFLFFLLLTTKFNRYLKFNIFLSLWLIGIVLILFESFYVFKDLTNPTNRQAEKNYALNSSKHQKHYIRYLPGGYLPEGPFETIFPLSGISNSLTVMCEEDSGMITYLSDRYGFNNFDHVWDQKNKIFLIGDSFIEGSCVEKKFSIDSKLNEITGKNYVSLGVGGNGPLLQLASMIEYAIPNDGEEIIWFFYEGNDLTDLSIEKTSLTLNKYLSSDYNQNLIGKSKEIEKIKKNFLDEIMFDKLRLSDIGLKILKLGNMRRIMFGNYAKKNEDKINLISFYEKILIKANSLSKKNNISFKFVYLPSASSIKNKSSIYEEIKKMVKRNKIEFIDLKNAFDQTNVKINNYFAEDGKGHFNEKGYKHIAEMISKN